jgi:hypothetical protein
MGSKWAESHSADSTSRRLACVLPDEVGDLAPAILEKSGTAAPTPVG